jgi:hypothetical protein
MSKKKHVYKVNMTEEKTVISDRLLTDSKPKGAPARLKYVRLLPVSTPSAVGGGTITYRFPSNTVGNYLDSAYSFFKSDITVSEDCTLGVSGIGSLWDRVTLRCGGQTISTNRNYSTWRNMHTKMTVSEDFLQTDGNIILGTDSMDSGASFLKDETKTLCDFLPNLSSFFATGKYIPLYSSESMELEITIGNNNFGFSYTDAAEAAAHAANPRGLVFENLELVLAILEVDPTTDLAIKEAHSGLFKYQINNYDSFKATIPENTDSFSYNCGMSFKSLNQVLVVITPQLENHFDQYSSFVKNFIKRAQVLIDGNPLAYVSPQQNDKSSVNKCFERISTHSLSDYSVHGNHNSAEYEFGSYVLAFDMETLQSKNTIRSGINVGSSVSEIVLEFTEKLPEAMNVTIFCAHDALVSMDLIGTRLWEMSQ